MSELRWRSERKYWLDWRQYHQLRSRLPAVMRRDPHAGPDGQYRIRSVYFDTFRGDHAFEKLSGLNRRAKYRIRTYGGQQDWARLEVKHRKGALVAKESVRMSKPEVLNLLSGHTTWDPAAPRVRALLDRAVSHSAARPVCVVQYIREALVFDPGNVRITFDKHLSTSPWSGDIFDASLPVLPVRLESDLILEVKFDGFLPSVIRKMLPNDLSGPAAISKYILCRPKTRFWEDGS